MSRKPLVLILLVAVLSAALAWTFHYNTDSARIVRIARSHGIELRRAIVTLEPLDSHSTTLGNSGHETYRVTMTQEGFQSVLSQIRQTDTRTIVDLESFGFTTNWSGASRSWASNSGNDLFVIAVVDDRLPVIEICSAW